MLIGHWAAGSGLARVLTQIALELNLHADVRILGLVPAGGRAAAVPVGVDTHPVPQAGPRFQVTPSALHHHITEFQPYDVIVVGPLFLTMPLLDELQPFRDSGRLTTYLPVEGEIVGSIPLVLFDLVDICILYTEDSRRRLAALAGAAGVPARTRLEVVGHGVDTELFHPALTSANEVRRRLFPDRPDLVDSFLVLNSNRAYPRKRLDLTINGFADFARQVSGAYLYLNACGLSGEDRAALEVTVDGAGITGRVLINHLNPDGSPLPDETLGLLYNACEVGVSTSMGEGWGLGTFEHAATGAAQIVPGHTSFVENWQGAAALLPPVSRTHIFYEYSDMLEVSAAALTTELHRLHDDRDLLQRMAQAAYQRAIEPRYHWDEVGRRIHHILGITVAPDDA